MTRTRSEILLLIAVAFLSAYATQLVLRWLFGWPGWLLILVSWPVSSVTIISFMNWSRRRAR